MNDYFLIQKIYEQLLNEDLKLVKFTSEDGKILLGVDSNIGSRETFAKKTDIAKTNLFKWDGILKRWVSKQSFSPEEYAVQFPKYKKALLSLNKGYESDSVSEMQDDIEELVHKPITEKLVEFLEDLKNKLRENKDSPELKAFIEFRSKFRKYSFYNSMLIWMQRPNATHVASANKWRKDFGRIVKAGEKGIQIFVPITVKKKEDRPQTPETEEQPAVDNLPTVKQKEQYLRTRFKLGSVFDISQTEPIPGREGTTVPEGPKWFDEAPYDEKNDVLFDALTEFSKLKGIKINFVDDLRGARGVSKIGTIDLVGKDISTFVHELAHEIIHSRDIRKTTDKTVLELQAEGVAYLVCKEFDMETKYHVNYLTMWKADPENIERNEKILRDTAKQIIDYIYEFHSSESTDTEETEEASEDYIPSFKNFFLNK